MTCTILQVWPLNQPRSLSPLRSELPERRASSGRYSDVVSARTAEVRKTVNLVSIVSSYSDISEDKHIPVTEEMRKELHQLKEPGQTYDELLQELAQHRRRQDLEDAERDELTSLSDV